MRRAAAVLLTAIITVAAGLFLTPAATAASHQVMMQNYAFSPASLTVNAGDTVTWTQHDTAPHNVVTTSAPVAVHSPELSQGQSWSYTFTTPGTYSYYCTVHPDMRAQVTVLPAATAPHPVTSAPATTKRAAAPSTRVTAAPSSAVALPGVTNAPPVSTTSAPAATPTAAPVPAVAQQAAQTGPTLDPMLLVAGLVTGVMVLCLFLIGSRRA
ncbi:MAG TPA: plastocyanin/azurin family copper-binding protein [Amycolatopsis sp.]